MGLESCSEGSRGVSDGGAKEFDGKCFEVGRLPPGRVDYCIHVYFLVSPPGLLPGEGTIGWATPITFCAKFWSRGGFGGRWGKVVCIFGVCRGGTRGGGGLVLRTKPLCLEA